MALWACSKCGWTHEGRCRPGACKKCGAPKEEFEKKEEKK